VRVFFDSSAFAKRYIREAGTDAVLAWCERATEIGLSAVALPEIISMFCRLRREGVITQAQYRQLKSQLLLDIEDVAICDLTASVLERTIACLEINPVRSLDALHVGSAVALEAHVFLSADKRQLAAAARAGLRVEAV
jgi:predicted nucleic acid-binding protein